MSLRERILAFDGIVVLRDVDHGETPLFWLTPMSGEELEAWWASLATIVDYPPGSNERTRELAELFGEGFTPMEEWTLDWPGEMILVETDDDMALWMEFYDSGKYYVCWGCDDLGSFLIVPGGRRVYHKGHDGERRG